MNDRNLEKEEKREKKLSSKQGKEESERNRNREIGRRVLISLNAIFAILHNLIIAAYNLQCLFQNYKG